MIAPKLPLWRRKRVTGTDKERMIVKAYQAATAPAADRPARKSAQKAVLAEKLAERAEVQISLPLCRLEGVIRSCCVVKKLRYENEAQ
jgi:hypothetical protein